MNKENYVLKVFISKLILARRDRGLSQAELANKLAVPQSYVARIEKGDTDLRSSKLIEMARVLGFEVMLIPRELVPAIEGIIETRGKATSNLAEEPLYTLGELDDEED